MQSMQEEPLTTYEDDGANVYIYSVCVDEVRVDACWFMDLAQGQPPRGAGGGLCFSPADVSGTRAVFLASATDARASPAPCCTTT